MDPVPVDRRLVVAQSAHLQMRMFQVRLLLVVGRQIVSVIASVAKLLLLLGEELVSGEIFLVEHYLVPVRIDAESGAGDASDDAAGR